MFGARGQSQCSECEKFYNNRNKPETCSCGEYLGGSFTPPKQKTTAFKISDNVYSVVKNKTGPVLRTFVKTDNQFCQAEKCSDKRTTHINSGKNIETFSCDHLTQCTSDTNLPSETIIQLSKVKPIVTPKCYDILLKYASSGQLSVFDIGEFVVVNSFSSVTHELPTSFCHVKNSKCSLQGCKNKDRIHALAHIESKLCIHELLACLARKPELVKTEKNKIKIDCEETTKNVLEDVRLHFPKLHEFDKRTEFLKLEKRNLDEIRNIEKNKTLMNEMKMCFNCEKECTEYKQNRKTSSFLVLIGGLEKINIPAVLCPDCNIVQYPKLCSLGFVNVHNKLILSYTFIMDICNELLIGAPIVDCLQRKLTLYADCAGFKLDSRYLAVKIEKAAIAILSALITGESLDTVICLICGAYPKLISTDGNVKDSTAIGDSMVFEENDEPPMSLETFLHSLQLQVLSSAFFQNVSPLKINMLKLPIIIAPKLLGMQQNTEQNKKSQFDKVETNSVDFHKLSSLVHSGKLDVHDLDQYSESDIKNFAKQCDIAIRKKSGVVLKGIIRKSYERLLSGESNCHQYTICQKRTGGWQDCWCEHLFKVAAKVQARQESVRDPVDIVHSLKTLPVLHICDDPCTLMSHTFLTKPEVAAVAFGERKGCFTVPVDGEKADTKSTPNVEDILPLKHSTRQFDFTAVSDGGSRHPDTGKEERYVMGHRLHKKTHKKISCGYHVLDLCDSGKMVKSMNQEALQVKRKNRRVRQDRTRNFAVSYLFNYILDFHHNLEKYNKQKGHVSEKRNKISWRAIP